jgi:hypothetical protein
VLKRRGSARENPGTPHLIKGNRALAGLWAMMTFSQDSSLASIDPSDPGNLIRKGSRKVQAIKYGVPGIPQNSRPQNSTRIPRIHWTDSDNEGVSDEIYLSTIIADVDDRIFVRHMSNIRAVGTT